DHDTDLDNGYTGASHNFPIIAGSKLHLCLTGCDDTSTADCVATGSTSQGDFSRTSLNGPTLGPPLPLYTANAPVCVVNRFHDSVVTAKLNLQSGTFDQSDTPIVLDSDVYLTNSVNLCPECLNGKCSDGPSQGKSCTVQGTDIANVNGQKHTYQLSSDCLP